MEPEADRASINAPPSFRRLGSAICPSFAPSVVSSAVSHRRNLRYCGSEARHHPHHNVWCIAGLANEQCRQRSDVLVIGNFRQHGLHQHWCTGAAASEPLCMMAVCHRNLGQGSLHCKLACSVCRLPQSSMITGNKIQESLVSKTYLHTLSVVPRIAKIAGYPELAGPAGRQRGLANG